MPAQDNINIVRNLFDAINNHQLDRATALIDDNAEWIDVATGDTFRGPRGFRQLSQSWWEAFPDNTIEITNLFADEESVCVEYIGRGTFTGPLRWPSIQAQPTGRKLAIPFCDVYRIEHSKIVSAREYHDTATMMGQLGVPFGLRRAA
ncbi:MAG: ester cyclase [Chloroflexi bacterium]|nr:ester cyclase [Chloroflexota bacterium]